MPLPIPPTAELVLWLSMLIAGSGLLTYGLITQLRSRKNTQISLPLNAMDTVAILLSPIWVALIAYILVGLTRMAIAFDPTDQDADLRWHILGFVGLVTALGALVSAPLALIRVYTTERQTRTAEQGHMTDRISKAVEQLGAEKTVKVSGNDKTIEETKPNIEVRIGGLLSLERISQDSVKYDKGRDHVRVMEIICAYIRENAKARDARVSLYEKFENNKDPDDPYDPPLSDAQFMDREGINQAFDLEDFISIKALKMWADKLPPPREDIAIALQIIGRRDEKQLQIEAQNEPSYQLDLKRTNLQKSALAGMPLKGILLDQARLQGADLTSVQLQGAKLEGVQLQGANLKGAKLQGANLAMAQLQGANLSDARLQRATLIEAQLQGADLTRVQLASAIWVCFAEVSHAALRQLDCSNFDLSREQIKSMFGDGSVTLPSCVTPDHADWPTHWPKRELDRTDFETEWELWQANPETYTPP